MKIFYSNINSASDTQKSHLQMASEQLSLRASPPGMNYDQKHAGVKKALLFNPLNPGLH